MIIRIMIIFRKVQIYFVEMTKEIRLPVIKTAITPIKQEVKTKQIKIHVKKKRSFKILDHRGFSADERIGVLPFL